MIPEELKEYRQWVLWRKSDKAPLNPHDGELASCQIPVTWSAFSTARKAAVKIGGDKVGLGFVFTEEDPFTGIDIDHCFTEQGTLTPGAGHILLTLNSYTELSPSGQGIHIIVRGQLPGPGRHPKGIGFFDQARYFIMTGRTVPGVPHIIEPRQKELELIYATHTKRSPSYANGPGKSNFSKHYSDEEVIRFLDTYEGKRRDLWRGDWQRYHYPSQSEADLGLCAYLKNICSSPAQMERILLQSGLRFTPDGKPREKWAREAYLDRTIETALGGK